jgi:hypothetical protein
VDASPTGSENHDGVQSLRSCRTIGTAIGILMASNGCADVGSA